MAVYGMNHEEKNPPRINGRVPVLVTDYDKPNAHVHFVALAPPGVDLKGAVVQITNAFNQAREADGEEWDYEDVANSLRAGGWDTYEIAVWEEGRHG